MKRFALAIALACVLSGAALADDGNMGQGGFTDDGNMGGGNIVASDGNMGQGNFTDDGTQGTGTSAALLTILDLMF
jgi:hypothetical protein